MVLLPSLKLNGGGGHKVGVRGRRGRREKETGK
jgi:hypothetical protein